jgi:hypothetical protein
MYLEIHKPELVDRVNAQVQSRHFQDVDEPLEKALDALEGKAAAPPAPSGRTEKSRGAFRAAAGSVFRRRG